ncbi:MAG: hypothetical protein IJ640_10170 [Prevotella sp.]|nr:hypothetical protein [Prevotella sp.]
MKQRGNQKIQLPDDVRKMLDKAVRYMISNLQYERHQARMHGCNVESYDKEIEEYKQLKQTIQ